MSLYFPNVSVTVYQTPFAKAWTQYFTISNSGTPYSSAGSTPRLKKMNCTDEDLVHGLGKFTVEIVDDTTAITGTPPDQNSLVARPFFPALPAETGLNYAAAISVNGKIVFTGRIEQVKYEFSNQGDIVTLLGYNLGRELADILITADYSNSQYKGMPISQFIQSLFSIGGIYGHIPYDVNPQPVLNSPPYPAIGYPPGAFTSRPLLDIIRKALSTVGYTGQIGVANPKPATGHPTATLTIANQSPNASFNKATVVSGVVLKSMYGDQNSLVKSGTSIRDVHDLKNWLYVTGIGSGADPQLDGLTGPGVGQYWTDGTTGTPLLTDTTNSAPAFYNGFSDTNESVYDNKFTAAHTTQSIILSFINNNLYPIKDPSGSTYLDLTFNAKTLLNLWMAVNIGLTAFSAQVLQSNGAGGIVFTDANNYTATWNVTSSDPNVNITSSPSMPWTHIAAPTLIPLPTVNDILVPHGYTPKWLFSNTNFNLSKIKQMQIYVTPSTAGNLANIYIDDCYFTCSPIYVAATSDVQGYLSGGAPPIWGLRDGTFTWRESVDQFGFTEQINLQTFGDTLLNTFSQPMLRINPLTAVIDPNAANSFIQSGNAIAINIPRWSYSDINQVNGGMGQWWRVLKVIRDWDEQKGYLESVDILPATNL